MTELKWSHWKSRCYSNVAPFLFSYLHFINFFHYCTGYISAKPTVLFTLYLFSNNGLKSVVAVWVEATPLCYQPELCREPYLKSASFFFEVGLIFSTHSLPFKVYHSLASVEIRFAFQIPNRQKGLGNNDYRKICRAIGTIYLLLPDFNPLQIRATSIKSAVGTIHNYGVLLMDFSELNINIS